MSKYYIRDGRQTKYLSSVQEVVWFLEQVVKEKLKMNRAEWMQHYADLGHGIDDHMGKAFTESLGDYVEVGMVHDDGKHVRCNIHENKIFDKPEYGD
jgi:hypothetical protein